MLWTVFGVVFILLTALSLDNAWKGYDDDDKDDKPEAKSDKK